MKTANSFASFARFPQATSRLGALGRSSRNSNGNSRENESRLSEKDKDPTKIKLSKAEKDKVDAMLPRTVLEALEVSTGDLQKQGWSGVPGARWVDYVRPRGLFTSAPAARATRSESAQSTVARFAVASQVPPRLIDGISLAEKIRQALIKCSDGHRVFTGKDEEGTPSTGNRHAFILPEASGKHGRVSHVTLHAPRGFDERARAALERLGRVWGHGGHDIQLILLGVGRPEDFAGLDAGAGHCPLVVEAITWESRTPFVPTRHAKVNRQGKPRVDGSGLQIGSPEHDLRRLLREGGFPEPVAVEPVNATDLGGKHTPWLRFRTIRKLGDGARGANRGFGFKITFAEPVRGPIALGYGAHFGLGQFVPAPKE